MPETAIPEMTPKPPLWERVRDICGLNFQAPKGAFENMKYAYGAIPFIREKIGNVMSMAKTEN